VLQCVAACFGVLQCVAVQAKLPRNCAEIRTLIPVLCRSVCHCVAACSSMLQWVAICVAGCCAVLQCVAVYCGVFSCVAVRCSLCCLLL